MSWYNSAQCFANVRSGQPYYTNGYCIGNIIIQVSSISMLVYVCALLKWHINNKGICNSKNLKTWILSMLIIFEFLVFIRYTFNLYSLSVYNPLLTIQNLLTSILFFFVLYYFTTKAGKFLDDQARTYFCLKIFGCACVFIFLTFAIL